MPPMRITKRLLVFVFYFAVQRYDVLHEYANRSKVYLQQAGKNDLEIA